MDAFAVSISAGLNNGRLRTRSSAAPVPGLRLVSVLDATGGMVCWPRGALLIGAFDHWIAFGLLAFVGGKMLWEARSGKDSEKRGDPTRGMMLLVLSLATSIDALAVGLSLAFLRVPILVPSAVIGMVTSTLTGMGATFGSRIGQKWGIWAEVAGGSVLLFIGARILLSHLAG